MNIAPLGFLLRRPRDYHRVVICFAMATAGFFVSGAAANAQFAPQGAVPHPDNPQIATWTNPVDGSTTSFYYDCPKKKWIISAKSGAHPFPNPIGGAVGSGPPPGSERSMSDPAHAFNSSTGQNFVNENGNWIDTKTGQAVPQPKLCPETATAATNAATPTPAPPSTPVTPPSPTPVPIGMVTPKLFINHFDAFANFDSVHTNGFNGTGIGESFRLTTQWNTYEDGIVRPLFTNRFTFERTNAQQSVLLGNLIIDENDDEDDCDDFFYYDFGPYDEPWGIGVGYEHYHPIYVYGTSYDMQGIGFSVSKFPNYSRPFSVYGDLSYAPSVSGNGSNGSTGSYNVWKYDVGAAVNPGWKMPIDLKIGYKWESWTGTGSTSGYSYRLNSPYIGLSHQF